MIPSRENGSWVVIGVIVVGLLLRCQTNGSFGERDERAPCPGDRRLWAVFIVDGPVVMVVGLLTVADAALSLRTHLV